MQVQCTASKTVQDLFIRQQVQRSIASNRQEIISNERVDLSQCTRHAVQFRRRNKVVKVARGHSAKEISLAEFNNWRHLIYEQQCQVK